MTQESSQEPVKKSLFEQAFRFIRPALFVVGVILFVYLIRRVGVSALADIVSHLSPAWVAISLVFWAINIMVASVRFQSLAAPELPYPKVVEVVMGGYLLNYASMAQGLGIGAKVMLMKGHRVPVSRSIAGAGGEVILDLFFTGMVTLVFIGAAGFGKSGSVSIHPKSLLMIVVFMVVFGIIFLIFARYSGYLTKVLDGFKSAFALARLPLNLITTAALWTAGAASYYCMIRAAGYDVPPLLTLAALAVGFVVGFVSLVPGGLGVRDVTWAYVCSAAGIPFSVTGTAALAMRFMGIASVALVLGVWSLIERVSRNDSRTD